jgi:hypothetical protein
MKRNREGKKMRGKKKMEKRKEKRGSVTRQGVF